MKYIILIVSFLMFSSYAEAILIKKGSGVFINSNTVLTNNYVVQGYSSINLHNKKYNRIGVKTMESKTEVGNNNLFAKTEVKKSDAVEKYRDL